MTVTKAEYERGRTTLTEAGFSEDLISRLLNKPKRCYSDSSWKEEPKSLYLKTGIITRRQITSTKGFPANSNPSQTVNRFISWLESETGDTLTHDKKNDSWSVQADNTEHIDRLLSKMPVNKKTFEKYCSDRGLNATTIQNTLKESGITVLGNGNMEMTE